MSFSYKIEKKNIRSLRIRLTSRHSFVVSAPFFTPQFIIKKFIDANQKWIETHAKKIPLSPKISRLQTINILDDTYSLFFHQAIKTLWLSTKKPSKYLSIPPKTPLLILENYSTKNSVHLL